MWSTIRYMRKYEDIAIADDCNVQLTYSFLAS
jgi:hypothetical protein